MCKFSSLSNHHLVVFQTKIFTYIFFTCITNFHRKFENYPDVSYVGSCQVRCAEAWIFQQKTQKNTSQFYSARGRLISDWGLRGERPGPIVCTLDMDEITTYVRPTYLYILPSTYHLISHILQRQGQVVRQRYIGQYGLDNVFDVELFNEAFRSPNHKSCFSFALGCLQNLQFPIHFGLFSPVSTQPHQNGQAWCKQK